MAFAATAGKRGQEVKRARLTMSARPRGWLQISVHRALRATHIIGLGILTVSSVKCEPRPPASKTTCIDSLPSAKTRGVVYLTIINATSSNGKDDRFNLTLITNVGLRLFCNFMIAQHHQHRPGPRSQLSRRTIHARKLECSRTTHSIFRLPYQIHRFQK